MGSEEDPEEPESEPVLVADIDGEDLADLREQGEITYRFDGMVIQQNPAVVLNWDDEQISREGLAQWLHLEYEEIAADVGWATQDGTSVPFDDLPEENQQVMLRLADRLRETFGIGGGEA